ncbi:MAG TPA: YgjP-like metallopeptidase domain-containing protein [Acidimicrobiales bacterium]|jgi:predicted metal-dependent hydrolase|nr:YgjP-like metallopeptidase domain-containing protein [Acidimicrobiales bacterium]
MPVPADPAPQGATNGRRPALASHNMRVEVIRSRRRRKTVQATETGGVVRVLIPATMSKAEEERWVAHLVARLDRRRATAATDLASRADVLAARYQLPRPTDVRWVDNQRSRWASCSPADGVIRVSSRLAGFPSWVVDYVLVHEMAHLVEPGHGREFWALVNRYRRAERARGFLLAKSCDDRSHD